MDKIDMSLDEIIKQNRKENRKQKKKETTPAPAKAATRSNSKGRARAAAGLAGQKQGAPRRKAQALALKGAGVPVKGRAAQLKQFRARIGGKRTAGTAAAAAVAGKRKGGAQIQQQQQQLQQQGVVLANRGPARKVGGQRLQLKRTAGAQVVNRNKKKKQAQQVQQQLQRGRAARQQLISQQRGIQAAPQGAGRKRVRPNRQPVANTQTNRQPVNQQQTNRLQQQPLSRRQKQQLKRLQQTQQAPVGNVVRTQRARVQQTKPQKLAPQRASVPKVNPKLLTVSISNPKAAQNTKAVKIKRNKQLGVGTLNDRFGQLQQQPRNVPKNQPGANRQRQRRKNQQGQSGNVGGRTVLLV